MFLLVMLMVISFAFCIYNLLQIQKNLSNAKEAINGMFPILKKLRKDAEKLQVLVDECPWEEIEAEEAREQARGKSLAELVSDAKKNREIYREDPEIWLSSDSWIL